MFQATILENQWIPEHIRDGIFPKQAEFLCYEGREALYGGAAGGGKSICILAAALQFIDEPNYDAVILRRTFKQLDMADSILDKAKDWLWGKRGIRYSGSDHKFTFPNNNTLQFGHMQNEDDVRNYVGGIWAYIGVDECTQFTEKMLAMPRTRQRKHPLSRVPMRWRGASNPGDVGHEAVKVRYVKDANGNPINHPNRQFFPARIEDNPHIDREDYVEQLRESGVDPLTLARILEGDWDAVAGGRFRRDWFGRRFKRRGDLVQVYDPTGRMEYEFSPYSAARFITADTAASTSTAADYTVISLWLVTPRADLIWLGCVRFKAQIPDIIPRLQSAAKMMKVLSGGERGRMPDAVYIEAIAANVAVLQLAQRASNPPLVAVPLDKGGRDKLVHATKGINLAATGRVIMPAEGTDPTFPLEDVLGELVRFTGDDKQDDHDDVVDTLSYAAEIMLDGPPPAANSRDAVPRVM